MTNLNQPHPQSKCRAKTPTRCKWHGQAKITPTQRAINNALQAGNWTQYQALRDYADEQQQQLKQTTTTTTVTTTTVTTHTLNQPLPQGTTTFVCRKAQIYSTAHNALNALQNQQQRPDRQHTTHKERSFYKCKQHGGYHLTSYPWDYEPHPDAYTLKDAEADLAAERLQQAYQTPTAS